MEHEIGKAHVVFTVHKDNPVKALSFSQLSGIVEGRIKNWKELGGMMK